MSSEKYCGFSFTQIGSSHSKSGKICQDASDSFAGYDYAAGVVCDGHGGNKHFRSDIGAHIAVEICREKIERFVREKRRCRTHSSEEKDVVQLGKSIILAWRERVQEHFEKNSFTTEELCSFGNRERDYLTENRTVAYGTTMLVGLLFGKMLYVLQLGDGEIRVVTKDGYISPIKKDERLRFGATTSLCDADAFRHLRCCVLPADKIKGCWLSSDGVRNSFENEEGFESFIHTVVRQYREAKFSDFKSQLKSFLPVLTKKGSGDDVSVAYLCGMKRK